MGVTELRFVAAGAGFLNGVRGCPREGSNPGWIATTVHMLSACTVATFAPAFGHFVPPERRLVSGERETPVLIFVTTLADLGADISGRGCIVR